MKKQTTYKIHSVCSKPNLLLGKFNYYEEPITSMKVIYFFYKIDKKYVYYFNAIFNSETKKIYFEFFTISKKELRDWFSDCKNVVELF